MAIQKDTIDAGKAFDWGRTAEDYAKYRDIYPAVFYEKIVQRQLCVKGQNVLDLGTGTGVLPRNMADYGADWIATDISENQILQAKRLSAEHSLNITYRVTAAEDICFPKNMFDVITACQCFWYFDYETVTPKLANILRPNGSLLFLYMAWLPFEDELAAASEALVLKYSPTWTGAGETKHPIRPPEALLERFKPVYHEEYEVEIPFTRETWHGRMKACRGIGASLQADEIERWEIEHKQLLNEFAPATFSVKHYAAMLEMKLK